MKNVVDFLGQNRIICKTLSQISPSMLESRKKVDIYLGVNLKGYYCSVFAITKKSRILRKEAEELLELHSRLESNNNSKINNKYLLIQAPLCSKAKALLEELDWKVWQL
ncbi:MAG: hypothetical protein PHV08_05695 [Sulfurovaceae bacterium]|jgi:hypothetical protein|nr:hypothetical protein [Sulfurovaceae bacterium]